MSYPIAPDAVTKAFQTLGNDWALLAAGDETAFNAMTISWGSLGFIWQRPIVSVLVRPPRYTHDFTERCDTFSVSFYHGQRKALSLMGSQSGRDIDKVARTGLTPLFVAGTPTFEEAYLTVIVRKLYRGELTGAGFLDPAIDAEFYPAKDYHTVYHGEILQLVER
jgi:flavin reductase (DIM6/NTAB) family NADH-FMN oxidoreductase RutF